jgi:AraC-like DNA-binding protein
MDYDFFIRFHPRITDVVERNLSYWKEFNYEIDRKNRKKTQIHSFALVVEGEGLYELNGNTSPLRAGCIFHSSPGSEMRITTSPQCPLRFYSIHFDYVLIRWEGAVALGPEGSAGPLPLPHVIEDQLIFHQAFASVYRLWNEKGAGYEWKVKLAFLKILEDICTIQGTQREEEQHIMNLIAETMEFIQKHYRDPLDRNQLAKKVSLSPGYFSIAFKKYTGYTPIQYITKLRLDKAKQLLRSSNLPIAKIAQEVGYTDSFYFARVFSKEMGLSPREFRNA